MSEAAVIIPPKGRFWFWSTERAPWHDTNPRAKTSPQLVDGAPLGFLGWGHHWTVPRSRLNPVLKSALETYDQVTVYQLRRHQARCDTRCTDAHEWICICSCGGRNHQGTMNGYRLVGSTTLVGTTDTQWVKTTYTGKAVPLAA